MYIWSMKYFVDKDNEIKYAYTKVKAPNKESAITKVFETKDCFKVEEVTVFCECKVDDKK